jgi:hypothetical protein
MIGIVIDSSDMFYNFLIRNVRLSLVMGIADILSQGLIKAAGTETRKDYDTDKPKWYSKVWTVIKQVDVSREINV